jgi:DNA-binding NarL/FixJ family response regulator
MNSYTIMLADDHVMLRQGLRRIIQEKTGLKVVGEAADGLELLKLLQKTKPNMVIMDISMPRLRGIEAIPQIKAMHPQVKVIILTMHGDREYLCQAVSAGADGYLLKEDADSELFTAIETIRQNKLYVSPELAELSQRDWVERCRDKKGLPSTPALTLREREILKLTAEGKSSKEMANLLYISPRTADRHRYNIMSKLKLKTTASLIKYDIEKGYV